MGGKVLRKSFEFLKHISIVPIYRKICVDFFKNVYKMMGNYCFYF